MIIFYMTIGLPGSGKDYLIEHNYSDCVHISSDAIREEVFGDVNDQTHNVQVFNIMKKRTIEALKEGKDCIYNATNLSAKKRIAFLKELERFPDVRKVAVLNVVPPAIVLQRNASRERHVPEIVIKRMLKSFEVPHYSEGWDSIQVYGFDGNSSFLEDELRKLVGASHDNPHHEYSVGNHMLAAESHYLAKTTVPRLDLILACRYHDIGKGFCKTFTNTRGESTKDAHYYNHENVGAYLFLAYSPVNRGKLMYLNIANLINHHMDYFKGEKYLEKIATRFGSDFMDELAIIHNADVNAH